jgi:polar amino acid transport system substrate-binding protein/glutamate/aspartate transport system substrate-binding protein
MRISSVLRASIIAFVAMLTSQAFAADTLGRIAETGTLRIGFRADAAPYSYRTASGDPAGYIVDLCREVANSVKASRQLPKLAIDYVEVTAANRFDVLREGKIDILCEPTSMTMSRRAVVDFSLPTFIDGAGVLFRTGQVHGLEDLRGKRIGVLAGTTTEETLRATLGQLDIKATIVPMSDHPAGVKRLIDGEVDAYFADRGILNYLLVNSRDPAGLKISDQYFTFETYALALPRGDDTFRLLVDATLAELYRTDRIKKIYARSFGSFPPDRFISALFVINGLPK